MRTLLLMLVIGVIVAVGSQTLPEAKAGDNKDKIIGVWQFVKATSSDGKPVPVSKSTMLEFTKEGKVTITIQGTPKKIDGGTYEVKGDVLNWTGPDKQVSVSKIKKLTDEVLILEDKKGNATVTTELRSR